MTPEDEFARELSVRLRGLVPARYSIETKRSLLYAISFDDTGKLLLGQDDELQPTRGGGTGFEQDVLVFERVSGSDTSIVPRVSVEVKFGRMGTHDSIVYSEKARRIRSVYPFVRYGVVLGNLPHIPARALRLGTEFDFICAMPSPVTDSDVEGVAFILERELQLSCEMTDILRGRRKIRLFHRELRHSTSITRSADSIEGTLRQRPNDR